MSDKILVTGSKGFIGKHLMKALGDRGINYDIKKSSAFDILNTSCLKAVVMADHPKIIVHLAAISSRRACERDPELALKTNIIGTFNVLRFAHAYKIKVILASSAATYFPELSLYGTSKEAMERLASMFPPDEVTVLRFFNVYGQGSKSVVNKFVSAIDAGKEITLNGNTTRDYVHVDDVVASITDLIENFRGGTYDVGTGKETKLKELVKIIEKIVKKKAKINQGEPIKEIQQSYMSDNTGFRGEILLQEGIRRLVG